MNDVISFGDGLKKWKKVVNLEPIGRWFYSCGKYAVDGEQTDGGRPAFRIDGDQLKIAVGNNQGWKVYDLTVPQTWDTIYGSVFHFGKQDWTGDLAKMLLESVADNEKFASAVNEIGILNYIKACAMMPLDEISAEVTISEYVTVDLGDHIERLAEAIENGESTDPEDLFTDGELMEMITPWDGDWEINRS
jgi:hypothetical protein